MNQMAQAASSMVDMAERFKKTSLSASTQSAAVTFSIWQLPPQAAQWQSSVLCAQS